MILQKRKSRNFFAIFGGSAPPKTPHLSPAIVNSEIMVTALWIIVAFVAPFITAAPSNNEKDMKGPVFIKEPENRIDFSNSTGSVVECRATASPPPEIIWVRSDGTAVGDVPGLRQVLPNGNLVFPPFRAEDYRQEVHAQVYACLAKNQVGQVISRDVHVRAGELNVASTTSIVIDLCSKKYSDELKLCNARSIIISFSWDDYRRSLKT